MQKPYKTLLKGAQDEFIVNKSRFIGQGKPVQTEKQALDFIAACRAQHPSANHNCYAYIVGVNMGIMRYSDDGEPGGTAGMPIIEVLKAQKVTDCAVVVTRYFGGVLLGAGGLVRAYSKGAVTALNACGVGVMHPTVRYMLDVEYGLLDRLEHYLKTALCTVEDRSFAESVTFTLLIKQQDEPALLADLAGLSDGRLQPLRFDEFYWPWNEGEN